MVQLSIIQLQCRINTGHKQLGGQSAGVDLQCYSNPANFAVEHDHSQCGTWNRVIELVGLVGLDLTSGLDTGVCMWAKDSSLGADDGVTTKGSPSGGPSLRQDEDGV